MKKWIWLVLGGVLVLGGLAFWWTRWELAPSSEVYRGGVVTVLRGQGGLDPGLAFMLRGIRVDLDCRDEVLCLRQENFAEVLDIAEQYEHVLGDYLGRICRSGHIRPSSADRDQHEQLCRLLESLLKEVGGIKMNASLALQFLTSSNPDEVRSILRRFLARILEHRERVLAITEELQTITWLKSVLPQEPQP